MPTSVVRSAADEKKWKEAKAIARKKKGVDFYAYVMGIYKKKKGK